MIKVKVIFRWYDFWIGFFYDIKKNILYFFPIPMLGIQFEFFKRWTLSQTTLLDDATAINNYKNARMKYYKENCNDMKTTLKQKDPMYDWNLRKITIEDIHNSINRIKNKDK